MTCRRRPNDPGGEHRFDDGWPVSPLAPDAAVLLPRGEELPAQIAIVLPTRLASHAPRWPTPAVMRPAVAGISQVLNNAPNRTQGGKGAFSGAAAVLAGIVALVSGSTIGLCSAGNPDCNGGNRHLFQRQKIQRNRDILKQ